MRTRICFKLGPGKTLLRPVVARAVLDKDEYNGRQQLGQCTMFSWSLERLGWATANATPDILRNLRHATSRIFAAAAGTETARLLRHRCLAVPPRLLAL